MRIVNIPEEKITEAKNRGEKHVLMNGLTLLMATTITISAGVNAFSETCSSGDATVLSNAASAMLLGLAVGNLLSSVLNFNEARRLYGFLTKMGATVTPAAATSANATPATPTPTVITSADVLPGSLNNNAESTPLLQQYNLV